MKTHTTKTSKLTAVQALEILQQSVLNLQDAGGKVFVKADDAYYKGTVIILQGVTLVDGNLRVS